MRKAVINPSQPLGSNSRGKLPIYIIGDDNLGRGAGSKWIISLEINVSQETLDIKPIFNMFTERVGMANYSVTIRITVENEFANADDCFRFKSTLPLFVPTSGALDLTDEKTTTLYKRSVIKEVSIKDIGAVAASVEYTILAGYSL